MGNLVYNTHRHIHTLCLGFTCVVRVGKQENREMKAFTEYFLNEFLKDGLYIYILTTGEVLHV